MKRNPFLFLAPLGLALCLAGCLSGPPRPSPIVTQNSACAMTNCP